MIDILTKMEVDKRVVFKSARKKGKKGGIVCPTAQWVT